MAAQLPRLPSLTGFGCRASDRGGNAVDARLSETRDLEATR